MDHRKYRLSGFRPELYISFHLSISLFIVFVALVAMGDNPWPYAWIIPMPVAAYGFYIFCCALRIHLKKPEGN